MQRSTFVRKHFHVDDLTKIIPHIEVGCRMGAYWNQVIVPFFHPWSQYGRGFFFYSFTQTFNETIIVNNIGPVHLLFSKD